MRSEIYVRRGLQLVWLLVRLPVFTLLSIRAPVLRFLFGSLGLLGVFMALFWKLVGPLHFPFILTLAASMGCALALAGYEALPRLLSR